RAVPRRHRGRRRPLVADLLQPREGRSRGGREAPAVRRHPHLSAVVPDRQARRRQAGGAIGGAAGPAGCMGAGRATAQVPPDPGRGRRARDGAGRPRGDARGASARVRRNPSPGRAPHGVKFPHPLVLLCGCVLVAAAASYVLPAGQFDRLHDAATGRDVVIAGTYHGVPPHRVTPFGALVAIPRGLADAAAVIFFVFLIGGAFTVVDETGWLRRGGGWPVGRVGKSEAGRSADR